MRNIFSDEDIALMLTIRREAEERAQIHGTASGAEEAKSVVDAAERQRDVCREHATVFSPPAPGSRVGIALQSLGHLPLHGLRIPEHGEASGWYLWAGESPSEAPDFYRPLCIEHLAELCPLALPFLGLPAGWRFLTDGEYVDVWYDAELLKRR
jgi:hypothetical protein